MTFTPPILRADYLVRHPGDDWIAGLRRTFEQGDAQADVATMSVALNNFAFVLFKSDMLDDAARLCRSHYRALLQRPEVAQFGIQPWINEGRLLARRGRFEAARQRIFLGAWSGASTIVVDDIDIVAVDAATLDVCRNVAIVDGFFLELAQNGLAAAERHLMRLDRTGASGPSGELLLQVALACNRPDDAERVLAQLSHAVPYLPMHCCYSAAISALRGDGDGFAKAALLLIALLGDWASSVDDKASIMHALLWLSRFDRVRHDRVVDDAILKFLKSRALALGDEELYCRFAGRSYRPLRPGSQAWRAARDFVIQAEQRLLQFGITA